LNKADYILYWKTSAERDWTAVNSLFESGNLMQSLFFAHLVVEKLLKAHWVRDNHENFPPRTRSLDFLIGQTELLPAPSDMDTLRVLNSWNIEGRYQDYRDVVFRTTTREYAAETLEKVDKIRQWLLEKLL